MPMTVDCKSSRQVFPPERRTLLPKCWFDATESFWVENSPREHLSFETRQQVFRNLFFFKFELIFLWLRWKRRNRSDEGSLHPNQVSESFQLLMRFRVLLFFQTGCESKKNEYFWHLISVSAKWCSEIDFLLNAIEEEEEEEIEEAQLWAEPPVSKKINPVDLEFLFWVEVAQSPKF